MSNPSNDDDGILLPILYALLASVGVFTLIIAIGIVYSFQHMPEQVTERSAPAQGQTSPMQPVAISDAPQEDPESEPAAQPEPEPEPEPEPVPEPEPTPEPVSMPEAQPVQAGGSNTSPSRGNPSNSAVGTSETMVWIPRSGNRYHSNPNCSNMKNPSQVTLSYAQSLGKTPCRKCY